MIFDELSIALFGFSLSLLGAELQGGVLNNNPPSGRGKSRGPSGRGLSIFNPLAIQSRSLWCERDVLEVDFVVDFIPNCSVRHAFDGHFICRNVWWFYASRFYSLYNPALRTLCQLVLKFHSPLVDWIRIGHINWTLIYLSDWTNG